MSMFDNVVDGVTKRIADKISDMTNGAVQVESILSGQIKVDANKYIDKVLLKMTEKLEASKIHDIQLPDHKMAFEKSLFCGLTIPADVDFQNGIVSGLTELIRMDDAALQINAFSDPIITAKASIGIKSALVKYLAQVSMLCFNEDETNLTGGLKDIKLVMALSVNREFSVSMDTFDVQSTGTLVLDCERLGEIDLLSNEENVSEFEGVIKRTVKEYLEKTIKETAREIIDSLPLEI